MAEVIDFTTQKSFKADGEEDFLKKAKEKIVKEVESGKWSGGIFFLFQDNGDSEIVLGGNLHESDCCLALERLKLQIVGEVFPEGGKHG